ncbi:maleylpyruvate isomerase family mycothiol-dependent enzyme [Glycomyces sp. L485]|uniref:maleylpyruvate isomerase family mycothiol-dependent enzyme n=1 Tax=Glycomyces sp. L485 TaxID=2909235 RepID=UPI001F4ADDC7|nr:maleylpyruvate isomerase family mycothiol-dependent enzyme [Glycomyces sp. L485]MCH7230942.1 maleylpyruvate isomerase family mycothiol-dependent enzyme [Glycomyces sp. L485]
MTDRNTTRPQPNRRVRLWQMIHEERASLASDLAGLGEKEWETPSLCAGLSVREVLAHLTAGASLGPARWMAGVIKCRFDFDEQVAMRLGEQLGRSCSETLDRFNLVATSTTKAIPLKAMLGETIVHGADIRRPLGIRHDHPVETLTTLAEYYRGSDFVVVARKRVVDLRLVAGDGPFAAGEGPLASGPTLALTMAMTGRAAYCDELEGDGVPILRERCDTM